VFGPKYNRTLVVRNRVDPGQTLDRMAAIRFKATAQQVAVIIEDVDGQKSEFIEKR